MIVEMNVFNLCKHLVNHDDVDDEDSGALIQDHTKKLLEDKREKFFALSKE